MVFKRRHRRGGSRGSQLSLKDTEGPASKKRPPRKKIKKIPASMVQHYLQLGAAGDGDGDGDGDQQQQEQATELQTEVCPPHPNSFPHVTSHFHLLAFAVRKPVR